MSERCDHASRDGYLCERDRGHVGWHSWHIHEWQDDGNPVTFSGLFPGLTDLYGGAVPVVTPDDARHCAAYLRRVTPRGDVEAADLLRLIEMLERIGKESR